MLLATASVVLELGSVAEAVAAAWSGLAEELGSEVLVLVTICCKEVTPAAHVKTFNYHVNPRCIMDTTY